MNDIVGLLREAYCRREPKEGARVGDVQASDPWRMERLNTLDSQDGADPNYDQIIRKICQVVKTGVVVRAACFRWDFLSVMRPNSFSVGAYGPDFFPL